MATSATAARSQLAVLISGSGSNLQALLDDSRNGKLNADICTVISNHADAHGLRRAISVQVPVHTVLATPNTERADYDAALGSVIARYRPQWIVLAGFMRVLSAELVRQFRGRLLNIHPALLPKYPGLHTHRRALADGEREHGCSVHFVTEKLDRGPVIAQAKVSVLTGDTEAMLAARVQEREHLLYPLVMGWIVSGSIQLHGDQVLKDGQPQKQPRIFEVNEEIA